MYIHQIQRINTSRGNTKKEGYEISLDRVFLKGYHSDWFFFHENRKEKMLSNFDIIVILENIFLFTHVNSRNFISFRLILLVVIIL